MQCFGDIAQSISGAFEVYLSVVAQVLDQATNVNVDASISYEMLDYIVSLREGIMDAWAGIIMAMIASKKAGVLRPYVDSIFRLLHLVFQDQNRSEPLLRSSMGVIGDLAEAFPNGELSTLYRNDWLVAMVKETRSNREFASRTTETARWAREQIRKQTGMSPMRMVVLTTCLREFVD